MTYLYFPLRLSGYILTQSNLRVIESLTKRIHCIWTGPLCNFTWKLIYLFFLRKERGSNLKEISHFAPGHSIFVKIQALLMAGGTISGNYSSNFSKEFKKSLKFKKFGCLKL